MMAFSRAFIAGENLAGVTLVNSPTLTFLDLRACGTGLRAGKVSILHDFTWIDLPDALLTYRVFCRSFLTGRATSHVARVLRSDWLMTFFDNPPSHGHDVSIFGAMRRNRTSHRNF
jgi:hypothetical protein